MSLLDAIIASKMEGGPGREVTPGSVVTATENMTAQQKTDTKTNLSVVDATAANVVSATASMTSEQAAQTRENIGADTPATVTAWLNEHVDPDTGYVIDESLTIHGAAADAKKAGDEIGNLKSAITFEIPSTNLYDKSLAVDGYLVPDNLNSQGRAALSAYSGSVLSGFIPVQEGKTYTIYNGSGLWSGNLYFVNMNAGDTAFNGICARKFSSGNVGNWPGITDLVEMTGRPAEITTFKILANSNITHIIWYIRKANVSSNYYGSHTGITDIVKYIQLNEGSTVLPFEEYGNKIFVPSSAVVGLDANINRYNQLYNLHKKVTLTKQGNSISVSSDLYESSEIRIVCNDLSGRNGVFNFAAIYVDGVAWAGISDDIAPIKFENSFIGANHGYTGMFELTFAQDHGLATADIGKTITDANSNSYIILTINSTKKIYVCSAYTGDVDAPITMDAPESPIAFNGNSYSVTASDLLQLCPAVNSISTKIYQDGKAEISNDGVYDCEFVDIVSSYKIFNIGAMLTYLESNIGNNDNDSYHSDDITDNYAEVRTVYRFTERGAITVFGSIVFNTAVDIGYLGGIQANLSSDAIYISVPKSSYGVLNNKGTDTVNVNKSSWNNESAPPRVYYEFIGTNMKKGIAIGYMDLGDCKDSIRSVETSVAIQYYGSSSKMYPRIVYNDSFSAGESLNFVAFKTPLIDYCTDFPAVAWYYVNDDIYLTVNVQSTKDGYIPLPEYMIGRYATVVDSDGDITVSDFVTPSGLKISVTNYGYATVKLSKNQLN